MEGLLHASRSCETEFLCKHFKDKLLSEAWTFPYCRGRCQASGVRCQPGFGGAACKGGWLEYTCWGLPKRFLTPGGCPAGVRSAFLSLRAGPQVSVHPPAQVRDPLLRDRLETPQKSSASPADLAQSISPASAFWQARAWYIDRVSATSFRHRQAPATASRVLACHCRWGYTCTGPGVCDLHALQRTKAGGRLFSVFEPVLASLCR